MHKKTDKQAMRAVDLLSNTIGKSEYQRLVAELRLDLLKMEYDIHQSRSSMVVVIAGNDLVGCSEVLNLLHGWMDPRYLDVHAFAAPTDDESARPLFWRYWRVLAPRGRINIFVRSWVAQSIVRRMQGDLSSRGFSNVIRHICNFEQALVDDGTLLVKLWLHLPKSELEKRLKAAEKNPKKSWRVHPEDRQIYENYDRSRKIVRRILRDTSTENAPWQVVDSTDSRHRDLTVAHRLRTAMAARLAASTVTPGIAVAERQVVSSPPEKTFLDKIDLSRIQTKQAYGRKLFKRQRALNRLTHRAYEKGVSSVLVFEGWDAAGKGGVIRRLTAAMDATIYRVIPVAAPTPDELARHYLWRFWREIPRDGRVVIFDRSWYGRVLVERVEGLAAENEWQRAYKEINDFEAQLCEHGIVVMKFWIQIDSDTQLRRFKEREKTPFKQHKITVEDFRNRKRWQDYEIAANEMIHRTNSGNAPWHLIAGNDKRWARTAILKALCRNLNRAVAG